jgi:hypothetical protein
MNCATVRPEQRHGQNPLRRRRQAARTLAQLLTKDSDGKARGSSNRWSTPIPWFINAVPGDLRKMSQLIEQTDQAQQADPHQGLHRGNPRARPRAAWASCGAARTSAPPWAATATRCGHPRPVHGGTGDPISGSTGTTSGYPRRWAAPRACPTRAPSPTCCPIWGRREGRGGSLALMFGTLGGNILEAQLAAPPGGQQAEHPVQPVHYHSGQPDRRDQRTARKCPSSPWTKRATPTWSGRRR